MLERSESSTSRISGVVVIAVLAMVSSCRAQTSLVRLTSAGKALQPSAVYECSSITEELTCKSAVADDTAHLSENPSAHIATTDGKLRVEIDSSLRATEVAFYLANEKSLIDEPKYNKLDPRGGQLELPARHERVVLIAIYNQHSPTKTKVVWLLTPIK